MGNGNNPSIKADLFSEQQSPDTSPSSTSDAKSSPLRTDQTAAASSQSYALPKNLPSALGYLDDDQLDRLLAAVLAEQRRRGKKVPVPDKSPRKALVKVVAPPLPQGKLNAIRAAFKAGFTPSRIARQFRISQSDVKKALTSDPSK
jgi:hypothetical protein